MHPYRSTFPQFLLSFFILCSLMLISVSFFDGGEASAQGGYSVSASPGSVHMGKPISVSWTAPSGASNSDWIGIYKVGDPDSSYITYKYTMGATSGTVSFNAPAFYGVASGQVEFRYFLANGYSKVATGNTVTVENQPPAPGSDTYNLNGSGSVGPMLANDTDPDGDGVYVYSFTVLTFPTHGTLYGLAQPDIKYYSAERGYLGTDSFTYKVCDPYQLCSTGTVTINLVNQLPVAGADFYVVRGHTIIGPYFANDYDPDGGSVGSFNGVVFTFPEHSSSMYGTSTADSHSFTPEPGYTGSDSFTYKVYDSFGAYTVGTVTLYIIADGENAGEASCNANVGKPINVTNGNMYLQETDYQLPAVGEAINVTRTYNSILQGIGLFGRGWSTAYDESIQAYDDKLLRLNLPDGRAVYFGRMTTTGAFSSLSPDFRAQVIKNGDGSFILSLKDGRTHSFNAAGKLLTLTDRNGNQTALTYDTGGKLTLVTDAFGRVLTVATNTSGRVISITDSMGTIATYTYGASQELLSVTYADNSKFQFAYGYANSKLVLTSVTDALGNVLESHTYDSLGRALTSVVQGGVESYTLSYVSATETDVTDGLGHVTKYFFDKSKGRNVVTRTEGACACGGDSNTVQTTTYDAQLNVLTKTNGLNQTTTFTYDTNGNMLTASGTPGTTQFTYNGFGDVLTATDPMQGVTTNTYDAQGNLLSTKDALNNTTTFTYDTRGQLLTAKDALNHVTTLTWDTSGRLTEAKDAANHTTDYAYDARGRVTSATNALNEATSYEYDAANRPKKVIYPDASYVQYTYDLGGRRTKIRDARGNETNFAYDTANRLTSATNADNKTTSYSYDLMSRLTGQTDALNRTTNYEYDNFNRLVKTIYPAATIGATRLDERVEYDAAGNMNKRIDTMGRETVYDYDGASRLIKVTDPASQMTQYEYNARSQMTAVVDATSQRYTFAYDPLGRVTQSGRGGISMSYVYDAVGNRTGRTDYNNATTAYAYDNLNQLTTITYPDATTATYAYDVLSRLESATNANGTVSFSHDSRGRVTSTTDVFNQVVSYSYDANGNQTQLSLGPNVNATYQYDVLNRLTQLTDGNSAATTYSYDATDKLTARTLPNGVAASYSYDGLDRLTRLQQVKGATTVADFQYQFNTASQITQMAEPTQTRNFAYDAADRLTSVTNPSQIIESFSYDGVGNRTASHHSTSYSYQPFNKVVSIGADSYSYDNNGNLTQKIDSTGTWTYTWDYENKLKQVTRPNTQTISYKYDALGRRVQRTPSSGVSTNYVYDGEDVIKDINSDNSTVEYLNGLGVDDKLRQTSSTSTLYFIQDHLGSTRALTDASGNVVENTSYDSFGNGNSSLTKYGYTGREWEAEANFYYYRNRWYDPQVGRFISEDPVGLDGGINLYAYIDNDPVNDTDPLGLQRKRGGPYHPPSGVRTRCSNSDSCGTIQGKMFLLMRMITSHQGWDWHVPKPRGGNRHVIEIGELWSAYANCQQIYALKCKKNNPNCPAPIPVRRRLLQPGADELRMVEESHRQMEKFWGKILGGSFVGGVVIVASPLVIRQAPAILRALQQGLGGTGGAPIPAY